MSLCVELGLGKCPWCKLPPVPEYERYCWVATYKEELLKSDDYRLKQFVINLNKTSSQEFPYVYWLVETAKRLFPDKAEVMEKVMILI